MDEKENPGGRIRHGLYRHYKGNSYRVVAEAAHSETLEPMVVYRALYGERRLWVRPKAMFFETVVVDGCPTPRFAFIGPEKSERPR